DENTKDTLAGEQQTHRKEETGFNDNLWERDSVQQLLLFSGGNYVSFSSRIVRSDIRVCGDVLLCRRSYSLFADRSNPSQPFRFECRWLRRAASRAVGLPRLQSGVVSQGRLESREPDCARGRSPEPSAF